MMLCTQKYTQKHAELVLITARTQNIVCLFTETVYIRKQNV